MRASSGYTEKAVLGVHLAIVMTELAARNFLAARAVGIGDYGPFVEAPACGRALLGIWRPPTRSTSRH